LRFLTEHRRRMVDEKTCLKQRLIACLKQYFPQPLVWFDDVDSPLVQAFLHRWPTLQQVQGAHPGTLRRFFHAHNCRGEERIQQRIDAIYAATPATQDRAVLDELAIIADNWSVVMATLREEIAKVDQRIAKVTAEHPEGTLFASLPGAGPALLPRLLVAFGTDRNRYDSASQLQCLSGIAPVINASGRTRSVHFRHWCAKFLRQTFHEFANCSRQKSVWAEAYYQLQRNKKKSHHAAVRALAYKWIRIIFRCWKDGKPYDELAYLETLEKRNSPLKGCFAAKTPVEWKTVAGFQKLSAN
jgi:transposase